ncbi:MAG: hypothetical protein M3Q80_00545 [bacterium]|nr:hypothetical protein [bacterium]
MKIKNLILALTVLCLLGCKKTTTVYSEVKKENATVVDLVYMPSNHGSGVGPTMSTTMNGDPQVGIAVTTVSIPEKYAVVFECQHGKFVIQSDQKQTKALYQKLRRDQKVEVAYREIYEIVKEKDQVVSKEFIEYDFIDAK